MHEIEPRHAYRVPTPRRAARIAVALVVLAACAMPLLAQPPEQVARDLTALLAKVPARVQVGLLVVDVADGQPWFSRNAQLPLKPASVMKLFVTASALHTWGPDFRFETRVYLTGDDLCVIGSGDPSLGDERIAQRDRRPLSFPFDDWAATLKERGVTEIGRIVIDDSIFDDQFRHPDWPADQSNTWYQAPVGALNFNDNCLDARADARAGRIVLVLRPELPPSFVENTLKPGKRQRTVVRRAADGDVFSFSGTVAKSVELGPVSAGRPSVFFGYALKQALLARGINVRGDVVRRTFDAEETRHAPLVSIHATPLADVLWRCNTFSQNLFAECLVKSIAAYGADGRRSGQPGSWAAGTQRERTILAEMGVDMSDAVLRDGSGLSHGNRVTAEQITTLLVRMQRHPQRAAFLASLAVPGQDGSMRHRYAEAGLVGRLRGKTGTLAGVHALAGYVTRPDGVTLAFALLCNDGESDLPILVARILAATGGP